MSEEMFRNQAALAEIDEECLCKRVSIVPVYRELNKCQQSRTENRV